MPMLRVKGVAVVDDAAKQIAGTVSKRLDLEQRFLM